MKTKRKLFCTFIFVFLINSNSWAQTGITRQYKHQSKWLFNYGCTTEGDSVFYVGGSLRYTGIPGKMMLMKTDSVGHVMWNTNLTMPWVFATWNQVYVAASGAIFCIGMSDSLFGPDYYSNGYIARFDNAGNLQWCLQLNMLNATEPKFIKQLTNGDFIIGGITSASIITETGFVLRMNPFGNIYWVKTFTCFPNNSLDLKDVYVDNADNIIIGGMYQQPLAGFHSFFAKMDQWGNFLWQKKFLKQNGVDNLFGVTGNGNEYIFTGVRTDSTTGGYPKALVIKTDSAGSIQSTRAYLSPLPMLMRNFPDINNNGELMMRAMYYDKVIGIRVDSSGNVLCGKSVYYPSGYTFTSSCIYKDAHIVFSGNYHSGNTYNGFLYFSDFDSCQLSCYDSLITLNVDTPLYSDSVISFSISTTFLSTFVTPPVSYNEVTDSLICVTYTNAQEVNQSKNIEVKVFPNPVSDKLFVSRDDTESSEIILYDIILRKVLSQSFITSITISTEQLGKGIYFYELRNKNVPDSYRVIKKGKVVKY